MNEPTTESLAEAIIATLNTADINHDGPDEFPITVMDGEPTEDVRSGGAFFEVQYEGQRYNVLIVEEGR